MELAQWRIFVAPGFRNAGILVLVALGLTPFCGRAEAEERPAADPPAFQVSPPIQSPSAPVFRALQAPGSQQKFRYAVRHSILSPTAYLLAAAGAGYSMAIDASGDRGYGMGAEGFSRRWGDRMGKATVTEVSGSWVAASLLRQDPAYYPAPDPDFGRRALYAASRVFITRGDSGDTQFNASNMAGIAVGVTASLAWNPARTMTSGRFFRSYGESLATNALSKLLREFLRKRRKP